MIQLTGTQTTATIMIDNIDAATHQQISDMTNNPAFCNPIVIMPDCHAGKGSVVGFTMPLTDRVSPQTVGVDIGCGVLACAISDHSYTNDELFAINNIILQVVPMGMKIHTRPIPQHDLLQDESCTLWDKCNQQLSYFFQQFPQYAHLSIHYSPQYLRQLCKKIGADHHNVIASLGTMGGGNHFCSIEESELHIPYLIVHTGSRNLGLKVCNYWDKQAHQVPANNNIWNDIISDIKATLPQREWSAAISNARLEYNNNCAPTGYLTQEKLVGYVIDMIFAQNYAAFNRQAIVENIIRVANIKLPQVSIAQKAENIDTIHNYIDFDDMVIRKGAIKSYASHLMIIPLNMRDGSLLCEGKSNPSWNFSAPHGAGRIMSRTQAKQNLSLSSFEKQMTGIVTTSVNESTLDEAPDAYKSADTIERAIVDTATIIHHLRPVLNVKASEIGSDHHHKRNNENEK